MPKDCPDPGRELHWQRKKLRGRRAAGPLGVSQAEAVAPVSFVSDLTFDASFQGSL
jgi:hypothetical protein